MRKICNKLRRDILASADRLRWGNPYSRPFRPADLKLRAPKYGSFSDHCPLSQTDSSTHCGCGTLTRVRSRVSRYRRIFYYKLRRGA